MNEVVSFFSVDDFDAKSDSIIFSDCSSQYWLATQSNNWEPFMQFAEGVDFLWTHGNYFYCVSEEPEKTIIADLNMDVICRLDAAIVSIPRNEINSSGGIVLYKAHNHYCYGFLIVEECLLVKLGTLNVSPLYCTSVHKELYCIKEPKGIRGISPKAEVALWEVQLDSLCSESVEYSTSLLYSHGKLIFGIRSSNITDDFTAIAAIEVESGGSLHAPLQFAPQIDLAGD